MFKSDSFARRVPQAIWRYSLAFVTSAIALGITLSIEPYTTLRTPLLYAAILITSWYGGVGPGLLSVALATLGLEYYFDPPAQSPLSIGGVDLPFILSFSLLALLTTWLSAKRKNMENALKQAHEDLEAKVRERTSELRRANEVLQIEIAERRQAEERFQKAQAELAHVTRVTTLGELAASIAHEINQPLAAIVTNGSACLRWLMRETPNLEEARSAAQRVIRDGNRASEVISRIRTLLRKTETQMTRLEVNQAVQEVVHLSQNEVRRRGVTLRLELASDLPPAMGDRVQLQQFLLNLVMNGVDAIASFNNGQRDLLIRTTLHKSNQVLISVRDCGVGIAPENLEKIFNAFYTTKPQGMGMGLAISRSIIESHGGRLWAVQNDGPGATFLFTLLTES
jgi:C4-dicarboxylate-specific signal transduction histidine kinase